jgi:hypothetical protein
MEVFREWGQKFSIEVKTKLQEQSDKMLKEAEANIVLGREEWPIRFWRHANGYGDLRVVAARWMYEKRLEEILQRYDAAANKLITELITWLKDADEAIQSIIDNKYGDFIVMLERFVWTYTTTELDVTIKVFKEEQELALQERMTQKDEWVSKAPARFDTVSIQQLSQLDFPRYILTATQ